MDLETKNLMGRKPRKKEEILMIGAISPHEGMVATKVELSIGEGWGSSNGLRIAKFSLESERRSGNSVRKGRSRKNRSILMKGKSYR